MFGTVVTPISNVTKAKLKSLDKRLKGSISPCLPNNLYHGSPKPLLWMPVAAPTPAAAKGVAASYRRNRSIAVGKKTKPAPNTTNNSTLKRPAEENARGRARLISGEKTYLILLLSRARLALPCALSLARRLSIELLAVLGAGFIFFPTALDLLRRLDAATPFSAAGVGAATGIHRSGFGDSSIFYSA